MDSRVEGLTSSREVRDKNTQLCKRFGFAILFPVLPNDTISLALTHKYFLLFTSSRPLAFVSING